MLESCCKLDPNGKAFSFVLILFKSSYYYYYIFFFAAFFFRNFCLPLIHISLPIVGVYTTAKPSAQTHNNGGVGLLSCDREFLGEYRLGLNLSLLRIPGDFYSGLLNTLFFFILVQLSKVISNFISPFP